MAPGHGDLGALRQKLAALDYREEMDEKSAGLVHRLLGDLLRVTEGFRAQKQVRQQLGAKNKGTEASHEKA